MSAQIELASREASKSLQAMKHDVAGLKVAAKPLLAELTDPAARLPAAAQYHDLTMLPFSGGSLGAGLAEAALFGWFNSSRCYDLAAFLDFWEKPDRPQP
tara:strand:- start:337 stop:636 length:300 start_codon:yes stop_codon:yes gene_type:complete